MSEIKLIDDLTPKDIAGICDHTFLKPVECYKAIDGKSSMTLRDEAFRGFLKNTFRDEELEPFGICVGPEDVRDVYRWLDLENKDYVQIVSVAGFPDGNRFNLLEETFDESIYAIRNGANEIDIVLPYNIFKAGNLKEIEKYTKNLEIFTEDIHQAGALVKLIFENSELNSDPKIIKYVCRMSEDAGVDFVKTSTGFGAYGATSEDLKIMRENFSRGLKIAGGANPGNIKDLLYAASGRDDGYIDLHPMKIRIGESSLISGLVFGKNSGSY